MKSFNLLSFFALILITSPLFAFDEDFGLEGGPQELILALSPQEMPPPPAVDEEKRIERFHKFRLMKLSEMAEEAGIDDKTILKISDILKKYDKQRFELFNEGRRLKTELKRLMDDKSAKKEDINKTIDAFLENRAKIQNLKTEEIKEIRKFLTPEQQARMILFMIEKTEKGLKNLKKFGPKHGFGPGAPGVPIDEWLGDDD